MARTPLLDRDTDNRESVDSRYNPAEKLNARETAALDQIKSELRDDKDFNLDTSALAQNDPKEPESAAQKVDEAEKTQPGNSPGNPMNYTGKGDANRKKSPALNKLAGLVNRNKKTASIVAATLAILGTTIPFLGGLTKLDMFLRPILDQVTEVPQHAVQQRFEYLATRWMTMKVMKTAYPGDENLVFCAKGGVLCHLGSTRYSNWFEKQLDAKLEKQGKTVKVKLNATGKTGLGGAATEFSISLDDIGKDKDMGKVTRTVSKKLSGHKEAKRVINNMVKQAHGKNYMMRFISKGILMRKYGVKRFSLVPDKTAKNFAERKANLKASILKNTVAKMSPRFASYIGCLSGSDSLTCQKTLGKLTDALDKAVQQAQEEVDKHPEGSPEREAAQKKLDKANGGKQALEEAKQIISGATDGKIGKVVSKEIVKKLTGVVSGPLVVLGLLDTAFKVVGGIDKGVLEEINYDLKIQSAMELAFNEQGGPVMTMEALRAGDIDLDTLGAAASMMDGAEKSPLFTAYTTSNMLPQSGNITRECEADGDTRALKTLEPGELICPENKSVRSFISWRNNPWWEGVANIADFWNNSIGKAFDAINSVADAISGFLWGLVKNLPGVNFAVEKFQQIIEQLMMTIFGIPDLGPGAPGENNYEQTAAALQVAANESMAYGQDDEATGTAPALGAGGAVMSDNELLAVLDKTRQQRREDFENETMFAKLFDVHLQGSMANTLAMATLRNQSVPQLLLNTPATILGVLSPKASANSSQIELMRLKALGIPTYGYADSSVFSADPGQYTVESCAASKTAREESLNNEGTLINTYKKTDPCALEKVIGSMLANATNDTSNPLYIQEPGSSTSAQPGAAPDNTAPTSPTTPSRDGWVKPIDARAGFGYHMKGNKGLHKGIDFPAPRGTPVFAAHDGVVTRQENMGSCGWMTVISTTGVNGIWHAYQHADPISGVSVGTTVKAGQKIATVGKFCGTGTHLHFSIETANRVSAYADYGSNDTSVDPKKYIPIDDSDPRRDNQPV